MAAAPLVYAHTCWDDECKKALLVPKPGGASWQLMCPVCKDEYYACVRCADGLDWYDNEKGVTCQACGIHLCAGCGFEDDCSFAYGGGDYTCAECAKKFKDSGVLGECGMCGKELRKTPFGKTPFLTNGGSDEPICLPCNDRWEIYKPKRRGRHHSKAR
jgi:hypothetical protein